MPTTMVDILRTRASDSPDGLAFVFLVDGEIEGPRLTYSMLDAQARCIAAVLQRVVGVQQRALLVYPPGLEFISAFFGCLYAGVTPVPVYPPRPDFLRPGPQPLVGLTADCQPAAVLGTGTMLKELTVIFGGCEPLERAHPIATDDLAASLAGAWRQPAIEDSWLALLQYTSGSTSAPRGVMVTHANLMHNERMIRAAFEHRGPGFGVCWLPPYHDMGLIGCILQPIYHEGSSAIMSPISFLQRPYRWLAAVSQYRANTSVAPNFAYNLCVDRITPEERATLDLTAWGVAAIGAEPVQPRTLERFSATFAECGFRPEAFYSCYGLAEATLMVSGGAKAAKPVVVAFDRLALAQGAAQSTSDEAGAVTLVGCGHTRDGQRVAIVDPATQIECQPGHVGEVWLAGPSVAQGYWNRPLESREVFDAYLNDSGEGPMLRTGDLGFVHDRELFISGRLKDAIIIHGRNHAPQDIEATVQALHPALRPGCGAAFETDCQGQLRLVVVQEVLRRQRGIDRAALAGDARQAVAERHEVQLHELVLLEPASIPKTSSGKVQRHVCRAAYESGGLNVWKERTT